MKRLFILLLGVIPVMLVGQNKCDFFKEVDIAVKKTVINSPGSDFGPSFVDGELWYSAYSEEEIEMLEKGRKKDVFYNVYNTTIDGEGNVSGDRKVQFEQLSKGYHAGPVSYCENTKELFVTLSNFENPELRNRVYKKANIRLKTIVLKKVNETWEYAYELPFNNSTYSVGHPSVSESGNILFFTSDIPEKGAGGTDLYMSVRKDGKWGAMKNLGSKINTDMNEMFPFLFGDNILIFSSNGRENDKEDLDLYYSCISGDEFSEPKSLKELNTDSDDFGLVIHKNKEVGYFSSARKGGKGSDDIYKVEIEGKYRLELSVLDKESKKPLSNAEVKFNDNIKSVLDGVIFKRALKKNSNYEATAEVKGYMSASKEISTAGKPFGLIKETIELEKFVEEKIITLENIFYDFDKWDILPESEVELNNLIKIMNDNPKMKIELRSHTDSRGSDSYNEKLSQKRSDSVVGYLIKNGISEERMVAKGYGETVLINKCANGVECTDEEHRKNRRTEFKILSME